MVVYLELWKPGGVELITLSADRVTIGRGPDNDVPLEHDKMASWLHAVLEMFPAGWCVRDLGSRNGTLLRGERILGDCALRSGDELLLGRTRLVFRTSTSSSIAPTQGAEPAPSLTPRERDVLVALCGPRASRDVFSEPASLRDIASALVVTEAAVQQHLRNLYGKFAIPADSASRRVLLANEAIRRGAVNLAELPKPS